MPILAAEIAALVAAGATLIQVDEPSPAIHPDAPADFAGLFNAAVAPALGAPGVRLAAHLCFGNYLGRPLAKRTYRPVLDQLAAFRVAELVLEFANREMTELDVLPELADAGFDLAIGVVDVKSYYLETRRGRRRAGRAGPAGRRPGRAPGARPRLRLQPDRALGGPGEAARARRRSRPPARPDGLSRVRPHARAVRADRRSRLPYPPRGSPGARTRRWPTTRPAPPAPGRAPGRRRSPRPGRRRATSSAPGRAGPAAPPAAAASRRRRARSQVGGDRRVPGQLQARAVGLDDRGDAGQPLAAARVPAAVELPAAEGLERGPGRRVPHDVEGAAGGRPCPGVSGQSARPGTGASGRPTRVRHAHRDEPLHLDPGARLEGQERVHRPQDGKRRRRRGSPARTPRRRAARRAGVGA